MLSLSFRDPEGIPLREIAWVLIDDVRFLFFYHVINWNVEFSSFLKKKKNPACFDRQSLELCTCLGVLVPLPDPV